jgi:hypothetical protein
VRNEWNGYKISTFISKLTWLCRGADTATFTSFASRWGAVILIVCWSCGLWKCGKKTFTAPHDWFGVCVYSWCAHLSSRTCVCWSIGGYRRTTICSASPGQIARDNWTNRQLINYLKGVPWLVGLRRPLRKLASLYSDHRNAYRTLTSGTQDWLKV